MSPIEIHTFWQSDKVVSLISEAVQFDIVKMRLAKIRYPWTDTTYTIAYTDNSVFIQRHYALAQFAAFIDDVVNDTFDMSCLSHNQLKVLYRFFGEKLNASLVCACDRYLGDALNNDFSVFTLREYFAFRYSKSYDMQLLTDDEAFELLSDEIQLCKKLRALEKSNAYEVFIAHVKSAYDQSCACNELNNN